MTVNVIAETEDCRVEQTPIPNVIGCRAVRITATTAERVQAEINALFDEATQHNCVAEFRNPKRSRRNYELFESTGYVFMPADG
jgi:hypothetical protein